MSLLSLLSNVEQFLEHCSYSSADAFAAFSELLNSLKSPETQAQSRRFFGLIYQTWQSKNQQDYYFSFVTQTVKTYSGDRRELLLLLFPSIFAPEEWSFTFYEGILRYPAEEFYTRRVVELGCGSGWITLAIALNSLPEVIYGVDINPRAIVCSQLNLYLNALDEQGNPILDREQKTLIDRVKFAESDLLEFFDDYPHPLDRIMGCIPQVLNPELEVMRDLVNQGANDEFLHSLSNYCEKQGYIEDQFGLGLLAKAIEQSIQLLRPTGKVIFNFGGRPGESVLERLMTRRGLEIRHIWQTRVEQDPDTDISGLVEIEQATGHRFEFFMTSRSNVPISAVTAQVYSQQGGKIYHSVSVYEGVLAYPSWLKQIFAVLQHPSLQGVKSALDLTENDADVAEERFYWLASLFNYLNNHSHFPYGHTAGERGLRDRLTAYFRNYHAILWQPDDLIITPSRKEAIANLLTIYEPSLILIDEGLQHLLPLSYQGNRQVIEAPRRIPLVGKLMTKLRPKLVVTGLKAFEMTAQEPFESLVNTAQEIGALLVVDISDNLNLSSNPVDNGLFEYLADRGLPDNVILLADLIKNRLYPSLSLCICITNPESIQKDLIRAAELSYSRVCLITQYFYQQLLEQLLHFQTTRVQPANNELDGFQASVSSFTLERSASANKAFAHPAIKESELPFQPSTIRLDYGENCLPSPKALNKAIAEAFARQDITSEECEIYKPLSAICSQKYGIKYGDRDNFIYGSGVASLFSAVVQQCRQEQGSFIFPQGAYGYFRATLDFYGVRVQTVLGHPALGFKIDLSNLEQILKTTANSWLYLNAPISNPTGALYSAQELQSIIQLAWQYKAKVVLDTIFSGLEFDQSQPKTDLSWLQDRRHSNSTNLILLGGISKEFSAAGIRFGYLYSPSAAIVGQIAEFISGQLPQTTMYAMRRFFEGVVKGDAELIQHREAQSQLLQQRAKQLTAVLQQSGWTAINPQGGLFLVAKPSFFLNKRVFYEQDNVKYETVIDGDSITTVLFSSVGLTINGATWTGLPNYCRFVLSVSESEFQEALQRIKKFYSSFEV